MKKYVILLMLAAPFFFCRCTSNSGNLDAGWDHAAWIGYEQLPDSMKVVPGVHGDGNELGEKCLEPAVVPLFRRDFKIQGDVKSATIRVCGLGHYELHLNGRKVGDHFLSPGWSLYQKKSLYNTIDVTGYIQNGENTIGAIVGTGFYYISRERYRKLVEAYGYPRLIFDLAIRYANGKEVHIVSDGQCRVSPSPITFSSIYGGEDYNATLEQPGWDNAGFDDSHWNVPVILRDSTGKLVPQKDNPLKVMQIFDIKKMSISKTGRTVYDFGQNASGIIALQVKGNKGARIRITPGELTDSLGNVTQRSSGGPYEFNYILKGDGVEEWQPRFTYYGFRYADVEIDEPQNAGTNTEVLSLRLLHTRNSAPSAGSFSCSDTLFNRIFDLINWGIKNNLASVATDCPHREKLGWLEQTYLMGPSIHFNFDIHSLYSKIIGDMTDSQLENGLVPDIAPEYVPFKGGFRDSPEWGSAAVIIPWQLYRWYGDKKILESAYPMMVKYTAYLYGKATGDLLDYGLGDWYDLGPNPPGEAQLTPKGVTATSIYYYDLKIMEKVSALLGFNQDQTEYGKLSSAVQDAFLRKYYDPETGVCSTGSQTAYAMPLYVGLIPEDHRDLTFSNLADSIKSNGYALTSGDIGYHFLVEVLSDHGRSDILYRMNNRTDRPGYGYQLKKGATALTESWAALTTSSNDHMMLGHLMQWFYSGLGGISQTELSVAYNDILIAPKPVGNIHWVKCSYRSVHGIISTDWKVEGKNFSLVITIPDSTTSRVILPENYRYDLHVFNLTTGQEGPPLASKGSFTTGPGTFRIESKRGS